MRQGTTPTHTFSIPVPKNLINSIFINYTQRGAMIIEKSGEDISLEDKDEDSCAASVTLTQGETLKLRPGSDCSIQVRFTTASGEAFASQIILEPVEAVLKDGVI